MIKRSTQNVGIIVGHPDDEILWTGGTLLLHPEWQCKIFTLCRRSDDDRVKKFFKVLSFLNATGRMADLDDSPDQTPLPNHEVQNTILALIQGNHFDLLITHGLNGEYTRHRRHEETSRAVLSLWYSGKVDTDTIWLFAYEDGHAAYLPKPEKDAHNTFRLPQKIWYRKYQMITETYGFAPDSWEAKATPKTEAFWCLSSPEQMKAEYSERFPEIVSEEFWEK